MDIQEHVGDHVDLQADVERGAITIVPTFEGWRAAARALLRDEADPQHVVWREAALPGAAHPRARNSTAGTPRPHARTPRVRVPRAFITVARHVACHRDPSRWALLYRVLWRLAHGEPNLLRTVSGTASGTASGNASGNASGVDADVASLAAMAREVRHDLRRLLAGVRFRAMETPATSPEALTGDARVSHASHASVPHGAPQHVSTQVGWWEPVHHIVPHAARLLARRLPDVRWSILTPDCCAHWNGAALLVTGGVELVVPNHRQLWHFWRAGYGAKVAHAAAAAHENANAAASATAHASVGQHPASATDAAARSGRDAPSRLTRATTRVSTAVPADVTDRYWQALSEAKRIPSLSPSSVSRDWQSRTPVDRSGARGGERMGERAGERSGAATPPVNSALLANQTGLDLDVPGAWDPTHDPGVRAARERAAAVRLHAPEGLSLLGVPVRVGTGAWAGPTIAQPGVFYPRDVTTPDARLAHYASHFPLAEIGTTFSALPSRAMMAAWAAASPEGFVFDVQAFALLTGHGVDMRELPSWLLESLPMSLARAPRVEARDLPPTLLDEVWRRFLAALEPLRDAGKLGAILMQFPRDFAPSAENFQALAIIRERLGRASAAVEFRHPAWTSGRAAPRTFALLERLRLTYVIVDTPSGLASSLSPIVHITTPELAVVRMLGRRRGAWDARGTLESERCRYLYDRDELTSWASRVPAIAGKLRIPAGSAGSAGGAMPDPGHGVHVLLDNCHANYATTNAEEMTELLIEGDQERLELWG